jgi:transposase
VVHEKGIKVDGVTAARLRSWMQSSDSSRRLVKRSQIVLLLGSGLSRAETASRTQVSPRTVAMWEERFRAGGCEALQHDRPGRGRPKGRSASAVAAIKAAIERPPLEGERWTARALARHVGVSHSTVLRVLRDANL